MLSAFRSGALRSVIQGQGAFRVIAAVPVREASASAPTVRDPELNIPKKVYSKEERLEQWDYVNSVYFGPERDLKNFPNPTQPETGPPVRLGIFPASWFEFFYPKTGVTGPYMLGGGLVLWMMSKEIMVIDHFFWEFPSFWAAVWWINSKFGGKLRNYLDEKIKLKKEIMYLRPLNKMRVQEEQNIKVNERLLEECETAKHLYEVKKEGVALQLEAAYRQRLQTAYQEVKKRLDYEVEKSNLKRKFEQDHMVNWIVSNVTKSITPQQEKESIQSCIKTLKNLAAKQGKPATA